jgi:hypothetical protein
MPHNPVVPVAPAAHKQTMNLDQCHPDRSRRRESRTNLQGNRTDILSNGANVPKNKTSGMGTCLLEKGTFDVLWSRRDVLAMSTHVLLHGEGVLRRRKNSQAIGQNRRGNRGELLARVQESRTCPEWERANCPRGECGRSRRLQFLSWKNC